VEPSLTMVKIKGVQMTDIKINGFPVIAYLRTPLEAGEVIDRETIIVLVDRGPGTFERFVTGRVNALTDTEWFWGHYFDDYGSAVRDMSDRVVLSRFAR
jgi:hypothetical protein